MKRYTFELIINEGNDEFWDNLAQEKKTGCEELATDIKMTLQNVGFFFDEEGDCTLKLLKFENVDD